VLFARSGVAIDCDGDATRFMTSASLVKALNDKRKDHDNLKVGAANHPLLLFLVMIIVNYVYSSFALSHRLKCAMKTMLSWGFWENMI
jgi:hypothetical protein